MKASFSSVSTTVTELIAGNADDLLHASITLAAGQNLVRGAVLGQITASGKYVLSLAAATDGSQTPVCVLVDDTNAVSDTTTLAYIRGDFRADGLTIGIGHTPATLNAALNDKNIYVVTTLGGV